jgi:hypothetical protein
MACQIGERSEGITCPIQSQINLCCAQSLVLLLDGSQDFSQFSDASPSKIADFGKKISRALAAPLVLHLALSNYINSFWSFISPGS